MIPQPFHGYHPESPDRVALVRAEPSADRGMYIVQISRGPSRAKLRLTSTLGPYSEEEVTGHFKMAVTELREEGYWPGGVLALLEALDHDNAAVRAHAALRLGWRRCPEAVDKLLQILPEAVDDCCAILDALGMIGDPKAIPVLREYAERKLLSRRRSAVEALRQISDEEGLQQARQRAEERLLDIAGQRFPDFEGTPGEKMEKLTTSLFDLEPQQQAIWLDTVYEMAMPAKVELVRKALTKFQFAQPFLWRAIKSIFKRSMLRHDYATFGQLAHDIEFQGRMTTGTAAEVKSGYDGATKQTPIFSRSTQNFLRRLSWRYLQDLARYRPADYAFAAAEVLIHSTPQEAQPQLLGRCYLLHQILRGKSKRYVFNARKMVFRVRWTKGAKHAGLREESYPVLWDAQPRAYLRLLTAGQIEEVHAFALEAIKDRHPLLIRSADHGEILAMLGATYEPTVELALNELDRRFDPDKPDWALLRQMLDDERLLARTLGQRWLRLTAHLWLHAPERIIDFLAISQPNIRALVVELTVDYLHDHSPLRRILAERFLVLLHSPESFEGAHAGYAAVAREALVEEFAGLVDVTELAAWIAEGSEALKILAGELLRRRPDAVQALGLERLTALAEHELADVRAAAHALLLSALPLLRTDPSVLFVLVESDWADTRAMAFKLLRDKMDLPALGLDGLMGLLDSNRADVQDLGKVLARQQLPGLPGDELVLRLVQHPHPNMRKFALELAVQYLPETSQSLAQLKTFCRSALLDLWPSRKVKQLAVALLTARGLEDAAQAEIAAAILGDLVRVQGRGDAERALEALVRIKLAHPEVASTVELLPGGVE